MKNAPAVTQILLFVFLLLPFTYWNSSFPFLSRVSSFTLTIKYSDMLGIPLYISMTFLKHKVTNVYQEWKNTTPLLFFIHTLVIWNAFFCKKFLKVALQKIFDVFSEKFSRNVNTSGASQAYSWDVWVVSAWVLPINKCIFFHFYLPIIY